MQHIYSMRSIRPPTAASIKNPLPPVSVAKSRKFISDNIGHAIRKSTGGTFDPALAKKLAKLIAMEKNTLRSRETASKERIDGAQALSAWAEEQDEDISDVIDKVAVLISEAGDLEDQYVDRYDVYRGALKDIRNIEKIIQPIRDKKQKLIERIATLRAEEAPDASELDSLEQELVRAEAESLVAEKQLSTITHEKIKYGMEYQFEAMQELGEKLAIIAGYGKHLLGLLHEVPAMPEEDLPPYTSHEASAAIVGECDRALTTWVGSHSAVNAGLPGNQPPAAIDESLLALTMNAESNRSSAGSGGQQAVEANRSSAGSVQQVVESNPAPSTPIRRVAKPRMLRTWSEDSEEARAA
ncbi:hypothetical protein PRZ48_014172 [Zasmidium cellare]|uniref:Sphingolipid long chain base-responsive protein LSP1 n=1 Tax=Zasmidium cellare TaxID=395010 RepID=A0ABR0E0U5_ZASCE|nr:hypothetical protein PRZ48_014172 [Zasmidium cellare]